MGSQICTVKRKAISWCECEAEPMGRYGAEGFVKGKIYPFTMIHHSNLAKPNPLHKVYGNDSMSSDTLLTPYQFRQFFTMLE